MASKLDSQDLKDKIFSRAEQMYCDECGVPAQHYAARFCAKEAFFKAMGTGWAGTMEFYEVEILPNSIGAPILTFHGSTAERIEAMGHVRCHVSLSHLKDTAMASVIIEQID